MRQWPKRCLVVLGTIAALIGPSAWDSVDAQAPVIGVPPAPMTTFAPQAPPPPLTEVIPVAPDPDYVWTPGYWMLARDNRWVWVGGRYVARPWPKAHWARGYWRHRHGGYVWMRGHWR